MCGMIDLGFAVFVIGGIGFGCKGDNDWGEESMVIGYADGGMHEFAIEFLNVTKMDVFVT